MVPTGPGAVFRCEGCGHPIRVQALAQHGICESCIVKVKKAWRDERPAYPPKAAKSPFERMHWTAGLAGGLDQVRVNPGVLLSGNPLDHGSLYTTTAAVLLHWQVIRVEETGCYLTEFGGEAIAWLRSKGWLLAISQ